MPRKISAFAPLAIGILLPRWGGAQARQDTIPFVGCPADGQAGPIEAPKGPPKVVAGNEVPASRLAHFEGGEGPCLVCPPAWPFCGGFGPAGRMLFFSTHALAFTRGLFRELPR